ncbi:hypothetical protein GCM10010270_13510 [Streptomyces violaceus]|nr:hypothetical protein GCM10010270_13510 [Streptomyces janthinus]
MVAELCHAAPKLGVRKVSLNFAVFRSVFEEGARIGAGPVLRLWRRLLLFFSKWWQLEALYRSNAKYHPEWYPRFLCYAEAASLARVGLASGIAEGFVSVSSMRKLWGRGHPKGGQRPVTTEGLPSLAALGLAGGDGTEPAGPLSGLPDQVRVRHRKLDRLRAAGTDPYPVGIPARTHTLAGIRQGEGVTVAGRIMLVRDFGGIVFVVLRDWSGDHQLALTRDRSGDALDRFTTDTDIGDHITATGRAGVSDRGEPTVLVTGWQLTGTCLRPLPDKRRGLADLEAKVRRRYLDLVASPDAREVIRARSTAVQGLRS